MIRREMNICKKCKKPYISVKGGVVAGPKDFSDPGLCDKCRKKSVLDKLKKL